MSKDFETIMNMNLVIVTSAIQVPRDSVFSSDQRFKQTVQSLLSVHQKIPNPYLVVLDTGTLNQEQFDIYKQLVNEIHPINVIGLVKNMGEATMLYNYFSSQAFLSIRDKVSTISKLCGRYFCNDWFDFERYPIDKCLIKYRTDHNGKGLFETRYFRFPISHFPAFFEGFHHLMTENKDALTYDDVEHLFFKEKLFTLENTVWDQRLGISGFFAGSGTYLDE